MRPRRAVRTDRRRRPVPRADRGATWAVGSGPREDRAVRPRPLTAALRVSPRLPRGRSRPGMRLRALGATRHEGNVADRLRARGDGSELPRKARAAVLALLR